MLSVSSLNIIPHNRVKEKNQQNLLKVCISETEPPCNFNTLCVLCTLGLKEFSQDGSHPEENLQDRMPLGWAERES